MPSITLTFSAAAADRIRDAFQGRVTAVIPGAATDAEVAAHLKAEWAGGLKSTVRKHEAYVARKAAEDAAAGDDVVIT